MIAISRGERMDFMGSRGCEGEGVPYQTGVLQPSFFLSFGELQTPTFSEPPKCPTPIVSRMSEEWVSVGVSVGVQTSKSGCL